jgi:hypothetical protein
MGLSIVSLADMKKPFAGKGWRDRSGF